MATKLNGQTGRTDMVKIDPRTIIIMDGFNPRTNYGDIDQLKDSIISNGVLMPVRVRRNENNDPVLIDGHRRLRACLQAISEGVDIAAIPAIIESKTSSEADWLISALVSNEGKTLEPIEEARAFKKLVSYGWTQEQIAKQIGKSNFHVSKRLELTGASPLVEEALNNKEITIGQVHEIVKGSDGILEKQEELLEVKKVEKAEKANKRKADPVVDTTSDTSDFDNSDSFFDTDDVNDIEADDNEPTKANKQPKATKANFALTANDVEEYIADMLEDLATVKDKDDPNSTYRAMLAGKIVSACFIIGKDDPEQVSPYTDKYIQ